MSSLVTANVRRIFEGTGTAGLEDIYGPLRVVSKDCLF